MLKCWKMHRFSFVFLCCHCCCCFFDTIIKCNMVFMNEKWNKEIKRKNGKRDGLSHTLIKIRNCCHRHQHQFAFYFYFGCCFLLAISDCAWLFLLLHFILCVRFHLFWFFCRSLSFSSRATRFGVFGCDFLFFKAAISSSQLKCHCLNAEDHKTQAHRTNRNSYRSSIHMHTVTNE